MRTEVIKADTIQEAESQAPWADYFAEVESDEVGKAWIFFESKDDYYQFKNQL